LEPSLELGPVQPLAQKTEDSLLENQALLSHAERIANFGSWEFDFAAGKSYFSKHMGEMCGVSSASGSAAAYWQRVHPADRKVRKIMGRPGRRAARFPT